MIPKKDNWGNQELPGISNEELLSPEFMKKFYAAESAERNRIQASDPRWQEAHAKGAIQGGKTKAESVEYRMLMTEVNREKAKNPEFAKNVSKGIQKKLKDPEYQKSRKAGYEKKKNDLSYKEKMTEVNRKTMSDPEWRSKLLDGIAKVKDTPEYKASRKGGLTQVKQCQGPDGTIYKSRADGARATGNRPQSVGEWCTNNKNGWKYL